jgi:proteasome lid subunit RPN8/RPN11
MNEVFYQVPGETWALQFTPTAIEFLCAHAQVASNTPEAVGQLYSRDLTTHLVSVEYATRLQTTSATRTKVKFDPKLAFAEREKMFDEGHHCVGLWHTHPEAYPTPSGEDRALARDYAKSARPQVAGIVFAIVGTVPYPQGFRVWFDNGKSLALAQIVKVNDPSHSRSRP